MAEIKKAPAVRFKGFSEAWAEKRLGEICTIGDIDHRMPPSVSDGVPYVMTGDFIGLNEFDFKNAKLISIEDYEHLSKKIKPEVGDVIMARYASVGAVRYVETDIKFLVSYSCAILKLGQTKGRFVFHYLQSNYSQNQIELEINTGSQRNIGIDSLKKLLIRSPAENEQKRVANLFQNLDTLISLHQAKVNKLTNLKKAMLEKIFPKDGADVPEIRFKGFVGAWEEKTLKQIVSNVSDGNWIEANHIYEEGEYRIIQTGNLGIGEFIDKSSNAKYFHQKDFDEVNGNEIFPGDILISRLADPAGRTILLPKTGFKMVTAVDISIIRPNSSMFDSSFLMTQLNTTKILNFVNKSVSGTSHKRISRRNLEKIKLLAPIVKEQEKIGEYFQNLDRTITLHQTELEKLNNLKKACLEKMFV